MSALDAVFTIYGDGLRALADFIDPPAPNLLRADFDAPVSEPVACSKRHYPKWLTDALDETFDALTRVTGIDLLAEETRRAEGTQHAQAPGEVSDGPSPDPSPSPGDYSRMPDSQLLTRAADDIDAFALRASTVLDLNDLLNLADALRDRAAQFAALETLDTP
ncbi:hypothetical protein H7H51_07755 [Mycolicibacterium farcinogenes]|nr:hypothetical protein [Mycolicibacterium farcinogenes]